MRQLIWKDWHEQAWKLAFGCIVLAAFAFIGLRTRIITDKEMLVFVCFPAIALLPLFAATGLVATERSDGSFTALAALPVPMWRILLVKAIAGMLIVVVPFLVAMGVSLLVAGNREMTGSAMMTMYVRALLSATALFAWMFASTIRLPSEARAAMVSIGVLLFWLMASCGLAQMNNHPQLSTISPLSFTANGFPLRDDWPTAPLGINVLVEAAAVALLWMWAARSVTKEPMSGI